MRPAANPADRRRTLRPPRAIRKAERRIGPAATARRGRRSGRQRRLRARRLVRGGLLGRDLNQFSTRYQSAAACRSTGSGYDGLCDCWDRYARTHLAGIGTGCGRRETRMSRSKSRWVVAAVTLLVLASTGCARLAPVVGVQSPGDDDLRAESSAGPAAAGELQSPEFR